MGKKLRNILDEIYRINPRLFGLLLVFSLISATFLFSISLFFFNFSNNFIDLSQENNNQVLFDGQYISRISNGIIFQDILNNPDNPNDNVTKNNILQENLLRFTSQSIFFNTSNDNNDGFLGDLDYIIISRKIDQRIQNVSILNHCIQFQNATINESNSIFYLPPEIYNSNPISMVKKMCFNITNLDRTLNKIIPLNASAQNIAEYNITNGEILNNTFFKFNIPVYWFDFNIPGNIIFCELNESDYNTYYSQAKELSFYHHYFINFNSRFFRYENYYEITNSFDYLSDFFHENYWGNSVSNNIMENILVFSDNFRLAIYYFFVVSLIIIISISIGYKKLLHDYYQFFKKDLESFSNLGGIEVGINGFRHFLIKVFLIKILSQFFIYFIGLSLISVFLGVTLKLLYLFFSIWGIFLIFILLIDIIIPMMIYKNDLNPSFLKKLKSSFFFDTIRKIQLKSRKIIELVVILGGIVLLIISILLNLQKYNTPNFFSVIMVLYLMSVFVLNVTLNITQRLKKKIMFWRIKKVFRIPKTQKIIQKLTLNEEGLNPKIIFLSLFILGNFLMLGYIDSTQTENQIDYYMNGDIKITLNNGLDLNEFNLFLEEFKPFDIQKYYRCQVVDGTLTHLYDVIFLDYDDYNQYQNPNVIGEKFNSITISNTSVLFNFEHKTSVNFLIDNSLKIDEVTSIDLSEFNLVPIRQMSGVIPNKRILRSPPFNYDMVIDSNIINMSELHYDNITFSLKFSDHFNQSQFVNFEYELHVQFDPFILQIETIRSFRNSIMFYELSWNSAQIPFIFLLLSGIFIALILYYIENHIMTENHIFFVKNLKYLGIPSKKFMNIFTFMKKSIIGLFLLIFFSLTYILNLILVMVIFVI